MHGDCQQLALSAALELKPKSSQDLIGSTTVLCDCDQCHLVGRQHLLHTFGGLVDWCVLYEVLG